MPKVVYLSKLERALIIEALNKLKNLPDSMNPIVKNLEAKLRRK